MKPDKLNRKIREASSQNEPAFTEEAWDSMAMLLDKEMPVKKNPGKKLLWIFILLISLSAASILLVTNFLNQHQNKKTSVAFGHSDSSIKSKSAVPIPKRFIHQKNNQLKYAVGGTNKKLVNLKPHKNPETMFSEMRIKHSENDGKPNDDLKSIPDSKGIEVAFGNTIPELISTKTKLENNLRLFTLLEPSQALILNAGTTPVNPGKITATPHIISGRSEVTPGLKPIKKFANSFAVKLSVGPDISATSLNELGDVRPVYGFSVSYRIKRKFSLETGIFVTRKVYFVKPGEYDPPAQFWNYFPDLKHIDADCKVLEIPFALNYHFRQAENHQWFLSAGLSSYFMKKEKYEYYSKTPAGLNSYDEYQIQNKNRHLFSSLRFSAGYEKRIGNQISLIAEPYINLPVKGIGYGKVNLYSAGILFSVSVKPFKK